MFYKTVLLKTCFKTIKNTILKGLKIVLNNLKTVSNIVKIILK